MTEITAKRTLDAPARIVRYDAGPLSWLLSHAGRRIRAGTLSVITPDGARITFEGAARGPSARITLHRWRALAAMAWNTSVGLGLAYSRRDWDSPDVAALIEFLARNIDQGARPTPLAFLTRRARRLAQVLRPNTPARNRRNVAYHYDIGNNFYRAWLDASWTYSAALFRDPAMSLEAAQEVKYRRILEKLSPWPGDHILEIGCGWGGFALFAAREFGVRVTGITLSEEQLVLARERAREAGLDNLVDFKLCDYRDIQGTYSHIVSIEMLEAVGESYWSAYFDTVARCLAPDGKAAIQSIVIDPAAFPKYRSGAEFIQTCIFPGGALPTEPIITTHADGAGLAMRDRFLFGPHYARTLHHWRRRFVAAWPELQGQGFDDAFHRLWTFYLAYCEGAFTAGRVDVGQWIFEKSKRSLGYKGPTL